MKEHQKPLDLDIALEKEQRLELMHCNQWRGEVDLIKMCHQMAKKAQSILYRAEISRTIIYKQLLSHMK